MKFAVVCLLAFVAVTYVSARPDEKYTDKFDNIDVDKILHSDRLLENYHKCLLGTGRCTPEGSELKRLLPDALATECQKCTEKQRELTKKAIKYLVDNKPVLWNELANKYDPDRKFRTKFEGEAKKYGINV